MLSQLKLNYFLEAPFDMLSRDEKIHKNINLFTIKHENKYMSVKGDEQAAVQVPVVKRTGGWGYPIKDFLPHM